MIDDDDAIGQALGLGQLVGGQEDRDPTVGKTGDHRPHGQPALGVDAGGGLVEEHHRGLAHQGQGQRQALLLAAGQPPPGRLAHGSQPDQVEELVGVFGVVVVAGEQVEHLGGAEHGVDAPRWSMTPMRRTRAAWSLCGSSPRTRTEPAVGRR